MSIYRRTLIVIALFVSVAFCMIPASADTMAQDIVINSDDTVLGTITSITPDPDAGEMSVTITSITRGMMTPQTAKIGDTLVQDDIIMIVPGAFVKVNFADRAESTLSGGTEGAGFVIRRGEPQLKEVTFTIPTDSNGQLKEIRIDDIGSSSNYILRQGNKITIAKGTKIEVGDQVVVTDSFIQLDQSIKNDRNVDSDMLREGMIWTATGSKIMGTQEKGVEKGYFDQFSE